MAHFNHPPGYGQRGNHYGYMPQSNSNNSLPPYGPAGYGTMPPFMTSNSAPFPINPPAFNSFNLAPPAWGGDPSQAMLSNMAPVPAAQSNYPFGSFAISEMNGQSSIPYGQNINFGDNYFGRVENGPSAVNAQGGNGDSQPGRFDDSMSGRAHGSSPLKYVDTTSHPFTQSNEASVPEQHPANNKKHNPRPVAMPLDGQDRSTKVLHEDALEALRDLQLNGVTYEMLAEDPVFNEHDKKLLSELYAAAGVVKETQDSKLLAPKDGEIRTQKAVGIQSKLAALKMATLPLQDTIKLPTNQPNTTMTSQIVPRLPGLSVAVSQPNSESTSPTRKASPTLSNKRAQTDSDRQKYLERLAAAKNKKIVPPKTSQEPSTAAQPSVQPGPTAVESPVESKVVSNVDEVDGAAAVPKDAPTPTKANPTKTDLVRQRLEALKRQNALSKAAVSPPQEAAQPFAPSTEENSPRNSPMRDQSRSRVPSENLSKAGIPAEKARTLEPKNIATDVPSTKDVPNATSPSLPGLTTSFTPVGQQNEGLKNSPSPVKSAISQSSESIPDAVRSLGSLEPPRPNLRKRPVSADFLDTTSTKRPYTGPVMQEEETCVIDISEDESEGEMEDENMSDDPASIAQMERSFMPPLTASARSGTLSHIPRMPKAELQNPDKIREARERVEAERRELLDRIARAEKRQKEKASNGATPVLTPRRSPSIKAQSTPSAQSITPAEAPAAMEVPAVATRSDVSPSTKRKEILEPTLRPSTPVDDAYRVKLRKQAELDADVASNQSKMEELRRQMQALEEENRRKMQDRDSLASELQSLGVDTVGMSHTDLQATKDLIENQFAQTNDVMADGERTGAGAEAGRPFPDLNVSASRVPLDDASLHKSDLEEGEWRSSEVGNSPAENHLDVQALVPNHSIPTSHPFDLSELPETQYVPEDANLHRIPSQDTEASQATALRPHADSFNSLSSGEIGEDDPAILEPAIEPAMNLGPSLLSEPRMEEKEEFRGSNNDVFAKNHVQEAIEPISTAEFVERLDPVEQNSADESNGEEDYEPEITINDSAPAESGSLALYDSAKNETVSADGSRFTPYESPLKMFRAYRYHPNFLNDVPHGFSSLTFLNKAQPNRPLCENEAGGRVCNDVACQNQHFKDMILSDNELILQLGTASPGDTAAESAAWKESLRERIGQLRSQGIQNTTQDIASKIVEFRRDFIGDPSRVLNLGSIQY